MVAFGTGRERLDALWDELPEHFDGLYLSFETDPRPERLDDAFPPATLERLRELKHATTRTTCSGTTSPWRRR